MKVLIRASIVFCIAVALHTLIYFSGMIPFFDFRFFDVISTMEVTPLSPETTSTVVVEIDEQSLQDLGQWPWPRIILAKILQEILSQKPAAVGFDIFFPEPDRTSPVQLKKFYRANLGIEVQIDGFPPALGDHDLIFANTIARGPTVLPLFVSRQGDPYTNGSLPDKYLMKIPAKLDIPNSNQILFNIQVLQNAASGFGFINASFDSDGIFRRQPLVIRYHELGLPCLALAMLSQIDPNIKIIPPKNCWSPMTLQFANRTISTNHKGVILNPLHNMGSFIRVSASDLVRKTLPPDLFTGKMVLIGASAAGLFDHFITAKGEILPGVFVHASLLENIIHGKGFYQLEFSKFIALALSCFFSMIIICFVIRRCYLISWILYAGFSIVSIVLAWFMINRGVYISLGYFLTPFSFLFFVISLFFAVLHYVERKRFLEDLGDAHSATIDSMTMVAESRSVETGAHIIRTKEYVTTLAQVLYENGDYNQELSPHIIDLLYRAAPLHDIGKVGIPDAILLKPGKLNETEFEVMKSHVGIGYSIIENAINNYNKTNEFLAIASNITYSHHEKWDGSGYPLGLAGNGIPLAGRLMALADVYDALVSIRCYKTAIPFPEAEQMIMRESGKHFDPLIVQSFSKCRNLFREISLRTNEHEAPHPPLFQ